MSAVIRCGRCNRRLRNLSNGAGWNVIGKNGRIVGYLCPACQTPEENAEAEIKAATLTYRTRDDGLITTFPKIGRAE